jgi:hypothetical protein
VCEPGRKESLGNVAAVKRWDWKEVKKGPRNVGREQITIDVLKWVAEA